MLPQTNRQPPKQANAKEIYLGCDAVWGMADRDDGGAGTAPDKSTQFCANSPATRLPRAAPWHNL
jgi:hypothetical protein